MIFAKNGGGNGGNSGRTTRLQKNLVQSNDQSSWVCGYHFKKKQKLDGSISIRGRSNGNHPRVTNITSQWFHMWWRYFTWRVFNPWHDMTCAELMWGKGFKNSILLGKYDGFQTLQMNRHGVTIGS